MKKPTKKEKMELVTKKELQVTKKVLLMTKKELKVTKKVQQVTKKKLVKKNLRDPRRT